MNTISFYKYQGTGNDFILVDNRAGELTLSSAQISSLCNRRFGIGSDGLMLIQSSANPAVDFELDFCNPDGSKSFCGNGSRCAVAFASFLGICGEKTTFMAIDGVHSALLSGDGKVSLKMSDVEDIQRVEAGFFLDTGSPHVVQEVNNLADYPVFDKGKAIRYAEEFKPSGTNINFTERISDYHFAVRTYERGVENETLSCGTGVTAVAIAMHAKYNLTSKVVRITTEGGDLLVELEPFNGGYRNIFLIGPTSFVFKGQVALN